MNIVVIFALFLVQMVTCVDDDVEYDVGPEYGSNGLPKYTIECPYGGALTGINYRADEKKITLIEFMCTTKEGKFSFGPFGKEEGKAGSLHCPPGQYISSFNGFDHFGPYRLGFRCRPQNDMKSEGKPQGQFGGNEDAYNGKKFDEVALSIGARPVSLTIQCDFRLYTLQVTYANIEISGTFCTKCAKYSEQFAPRHGGDDGILHTVVCPAEGVIIGFTYRFGSAGDSLLALGLICSSSIGTEEFGPFGYEGDGSNFGSDILHRETCPRGQYVSSIHGSSSEKNLLSMGIRCSTVGQTTRSPKRDSRGLKGKKEQNFDDVEFSLHMQRPVQARIRTLNNKILSIQMKYGNMPIALKCEVTKIEVTDKNLVAKDVGYQLVGVATTSSCTSETLSVSVTNSDTLEESTEVTVSDGGDVNFSASLSIDFIVGVGGFGVDVALSLGASYTQGSSRTWSTSDSKSTNRINTASLGGTINCKGPGACVVVGAVKKYVLERKSVPVLYHYECAGGSLTPQRKKIKLSSTDYGQGSFFDFTHPFKTPAECSTKVRKCVANLESNRAVADPFSIEVEFNKCFV